MPYHDDEDIQIAIKVGDLIYIMESANIIHAAIDQQRESAHALSHGGARSGNHAGPSTFTFDLKLQGDSVTVHTADLFEEDHVRAIRPAQPPAQLPTPPATIELPPPGVIDHSD